MRAPVTTTLLAVLATDLQAGLLDLFPFGNPRRVPLAHQFTPGTELTYSFHSTLEQDISSSGRRMRFGIRTDGTARQIVAGLDRRTGTALIGQLGRSRWERQEGEDGRTVQSGEQTWSSAWRMERSGRPLRRPSPADGAVPPALRLALSQIAESSQPSTPFPRGRIGIGSRWEGDLLLPMPGMRVPARAVSVVVAIREEAGTTLCVISNTACSETVNMHMDWMPDVWRPEAIVRGASHAVFDARRGCWQEVRWDLSAALEGEGFSGALRVRSAIELRGARVLPDDEGRAWQNRIAKFDAALARLYEKDGMRPAIDMLDDQRVAERDDDWLQGLDLTVALVNAVRTPVLSPFSDEKPPPRRTGPVADLLRAGDRAALDSRWTDALMRYEHVAQQYPDDEGAPEALLAAARIRERILNQKERADALRCDAISRQEQRTPGEAGPAAAAATYRLACAYEEAQRWTDALQAYRRFLAAPASSQGWMLTLARYRVAKLLERVGRREEALDAYRVVVDAEPADEYSARLAARAEERARELSGRTDAGKRTE